MATLYGSNATFRDNSAPPSKIPTGEVSGRLRLAYDSYSLSAALGASDLIKLQMIPAGARVVEVVVATDDLGTTGTGKLGWAASSDAADVFTMSATQANVPGQFKQFSSPVQVQLQMTAATTATTGSIKVAVWYVVD
jgi:hypothetical protein